MKYDSKNPSYIRELFDSIAPRYDFANSLLSFHLYTFWNRALVKTALKKVKPNNILDLCSGTGQIAFRLLSKMEKNRILPEKCHLVDLSPNMLSYAKKRSEKFSPEIQKLLSFKEANAESLPFDSDSFELITCAYGIRNIREPENAFKEMYRVLKPSGISAILELTRPKNSFLRMGHSLFLRTYAPLVGRLFTPNEEAYSYLNKSIYSFMKPDKLSLIAKKSGFSKTETIPLFKGMATLLILQK